MYLLFLPASRNNNPESRRLLDIATANSVPMSGRTTLCHMLTTSGTVYSELTVTCLEEDRFLILTGGGSELHDLRRLEDIARTEKLSVSLANVTERLGTLTVAGPRSKDLMARITDQVSRKWQPRRIRRREKLYK